MRRIFAKIAAVICVCMVVGGCSVRDGMAGAFGMRIVSPESAELDDVIAAIALNPSSKKFETVDKGYVHSYTAMAARNTSRRKVCSNSTSCGTAPACSSRTRSVTT